MYNFQSSSETLVFNDSDIIILDLLKVFASFDSVSRNKKARILRALKNMKNTVAQPVSSIHKSFVVSFELSSSKRTYMTERERKRKRRDQMGRTFLVKNDTVWDRPRAGLSLLV